eukprot:359547-Chlamydomonas_euryale.AAC.1
MPLGDHLDRLSSFLKAQEGATWHTGLQPGGGFLKGASWILVSDLVLGHQPAKPFSFQPL